MVDHRETVLVRVIGPREKGFNSIIFRYPVDRYCHGIRHSARGGDIYRFSIYPSLAGSFDDQQRKTSCADCI